MAIQKCFSFVDVELETDIKICFVRVKITFFHALIRACYKPPNADAVFIQDLYKVMNFVTLRYPQCPIFSRGGGNLIILVLIGLIVFLIVPAEIFLSVETSLTFVNLAHSIRLY